MGPLISEEQRRKVIFYVEKARKEGAKLVCGGKIPVAQELKNGFFFEPTVFTDALPQMSIFQEEIFGPVVCVNKFSRIEEAIALANQTDFALACSIWSKDSALAQDLANKVNAGIIWINTYGMFYDALPYGGFKQSGFGKELGREGFLEYSRLKNIVTDTTQEGLPLVNYWYGF
jgi:acyl-CoA reductase-like NAD-dependent aldehyde dehydrogenase